ncbi:DUF6507 family protein [Streptomyces zagrosensis]|uniref:Uncharacterized protein n=1 Tax=Streptomyces zagrosensis TaxID=1042984 RepID=A0A7W9UX55_9ACTN|nr:DUF6507 family protein [Streptomyces zagrosensis]MBB5933931.1 hypothetical protein [Streptomyces zagrosensis]
MTGWDLRPPDIGRTLEATIAIAKEIEGQAKSFGEHVKSAATNAGTLAMGGEKPEAGLVGLALSEFAAQSEKDLRFIAARAAKSIQGASDATTAYMNGNLQMAADTQREARKQPDPDFGKPQGDKK